MNQPTDKLPFNYNDADVSKLLFPVELRPVFVSMPPTTEEDSDLGHLSIFHSEHCVPEDDIQQIHQYEALIDVERQHVCTIVSNNYEVITNEQAIKLGELCFNTVFKITSANKMRLFNIIMPSTRSFCHIDYVHEAGTREIFDGDLWQPFIRITNSYNKTHALKFDLGFCRGICKNGMIFGKQNIEFKFSHTKQQQDLLEATFTLRSGEFSHLEREFMESLRSLKRYHVPRKLMWPLLCKVFQLKKPADDASLAKQESWKRSHHLTEKHMEHYFDLLGENGYAALNVLTDFATRPPQGGFGFSRINTMQVRCGDWTEDFCSAIEANDFTFEDYLGEYFQLSA